MPLSGASVIPALPFNHVPSSPRSDISTPATERSEVPEGTVSNKQPVPRITGNSTEPHLALQVRASSGLAADYSCRGNLIQRENFQKDGVGIDGDMQLRDGESRHRVPVLLHQMPPPVSAVTCQVTPNTYQKRPLQMQLPCPPSPNSNQKHNNRLGRPPLHHIHRPPNNKPPLCPLPLDPRLNPGLPSSAKT